MWGEERALPAALASVVVAAFPAFAQLADAHPSMFVDLCREGWRSARTRARLLGSITAKTGDLGDADAARSGLRLAVQYEKLRIATRELLPRALDGADVDTTSAEIAVLAEASIEVALAEAVHYAKARWGAPVSSSGAPSTFVVIGMGKLGGRELNAGSDIDVLYLYDTDEGIAVSESGSEISLHEYWSQVGRRLTANLDANTPEGMVWRVDLRLRPEGSQGPVANSLPAAERYYETFGRLWERAALLRARPVAGDLELGRAALEELTPFVYARPVHPQIAVELVKLSERARVELSTDPARDLKLGRGGIREAELFVQTLQLVWGGQEPRVRATGTLDALRRLRGRGLVTDREESAVEAAYLLFRRLEHRIQWSTGLQTHTLPSEPAAETRLARSLGYADAPALAREVERARSEVRERLSSLLPQGITESAVPGRFSELIHRLEEGDPKAIDEAIARAFGPSATVELCRDIRQLSRRPDDLLGSMTRERIPNRRRATFAPGSGGSGHPVCTCGHSAKTCERCEGSSVPSARARSSATPSPIARSSAKASCSRVAFRTRSSRPTRSYRSSARSIFSLRRRAIRRRSSARCAARRRG
jgi:glutamate-ammonia-ligase adenylyltransferase